MRTATYWRMRGACLAGPVALAFLAFAASPLAARDNALGLTYVSADPSAFVDNAVVAGWARRFDESAVRDHAYRLWAAITAPTGEMISVVDPRGRRVTAPAATFETWFDEFEVFHVEPAALAACAGPCAGAHFLHKPRQKPGAASVVSYNKYSAEFADYIDRNHYWGGETLSDLNAGFDRARTPLAGRIVPAAPPPHAVMLKPSYWIVKADRPSAMPYWKGPGLDVAGTTDMTTPVPTTWTEFVVVDPTGAGRAGVPATIEAPTPEGSRPVATAGAPVVGLDRFYWFPLSEKDVCFLKAGNVFIVGGVALKDLEPGDLALLVGMHVTTNEDVENWTWQTFWWRPEAGPGRGTLRQAAVRFVSRSRPPTGWSARRDAARRLQPLSRGARHRFDLPRPHDARRQVELHVVSTTPRPFRR